MRATLAFSAVVLVLTPGLAPAQELGLRRLVDCPTAEVLERGSYSLNALVYPEGGLLAGVSVGLVERFSIGFSYGGLEVIGSGEPDWNPRVEFRARLRVVDESFALPAVALGYDSQGFGRYYEDPPGGLEPDAELREPIDRYQVKSKGFYAVASKHYALLGVLGLHGGLNYSLETGDEDKTLDFFLGVEKSLSAAVSVIAEYDAAVNDNEEGNAFGESAGYLNVGLSWLFAERLRIEFDLRNLLENSEGDFKEIGQWSRGIQIEYLEFF